MDKRTDAVLAWVKKHRPDLIAHFDSILKYNDSNERLDAMRLLVYIGFEAGRQFQAKRPKAELNNPNIYEG